VPARPAGWVWHDVLPTSSDRKDQSRRPDEYETDSGGESEDARPRVSWPSRRRARCRGEIGHSRRSPDFNQGDNEGSGYFEVIPAPRSALEVPRDGGFEADPSRGRTCTCGPAACGADPVEGRRATGLRYSEHGVRQRSPGEWRIILAAGSHRLRPSSWGLGRGARIVTAIGAPVITRYQGRAKICRTLQLRAILAVTGAKHA